MGWNIESEGRLVGDEVKEVSRNQTRRSGFTFPGSIFSGPESSPSSLHISWKRDFHGRPKERH